MTDKNQIRPIKYRAYAGIKEFTDDALLHKSMLMQSVETGRILHPSIISNELVECGDYRIPYDSLVERYVWIDDGTPCGMPI